MAPLKVLLTRTLPKQGMDLLAKHSDKIAVTQWKEDGPAKRDFLLENIKGADGLLCMLNDKVDEQLIAAAGDKLKIVSTMSAGFDHIEAGSLKSRNVRLGSTPDALTDATADTGAMLTLMASRRAGEGVRAVVDGKWPTMPWAPLLLCGHALQNATVGVLGFGKIGQCTLKRLAGFGIKRALYLNSKPGVPLSADKDYYGLTTRGPSDVEIRPASSLDELARESDFLLLCCALTDGTRKVVGKDFLSKMKSNAYVINTARGAVVDSDALVEAVSSGKIAGAGLDVVDGEPNVPADHPLVKENKIVVLPHIGSATYETRGLMAAQSVLNLLAGLEISEGEWINEVKL